MTEQEIHSRLKQLTLERGPRQESQVTEQQLREMRESLSRKQQALDKEKKARARDQEQARKTKMALKRELSETKKTLRQQEEQKGEIQLSIVDYLCKSSTLKSG